jgi:hypothetical protein
MAYRVPKGATVVAKRSVHVVREHNKGPRTPLADFFNILRMARDMVRNDSRDVLYYDVRGPHFVEIEKISIAEYLGGREDRWLTGVFTFFLVPF